MLRGLYTLSREAGWIWKGDMEKEGLRTGIGYLGLARVVVKKGGIYEGTN